MNPAQDELMSALARLFESGRYSDLTVICKDRRYKVHKALLCSRSHFFDGACSGRFLESQSGEIDMSEEDPEVVGHLLHYLYYLEYEAEEEEEGQQNTPSAAFRPSTTTRTPKLDMSLVSDPLMDTAAGSASSPPASRFNSPSISNQQQRPTSIQQSQQRLPKPLSRRAINSRHRGARSQDPPLTPGSSGNDADEQGDMEMDSDGSSEDDTDSSIPTAPLLLHARLYSAAEKYGIPGLKALSKTKFEQLLFPPSLEAFKTSPLSDVAQRDIFLTQDFPAAMEEVYTGTVEADRGLRNAILQAFRAHPEWARKEGVGEVVRAYGSLGWDLYRISNGMGSAA